MDEDGQVQLLRARVASLEQLVTGLRDQLEKAVRAEVLHRAGSTGPMPAVSVPRPRPSRHRRPRSAETPWLHVVKVATIGVLAAGVIAGAVIPASSIVAGPVEAGTTLPHALCDPPGFAPPSANGVWQLDMAPGGGPCIEIPSGP